MHDSLMKREKGDAVIIGASSTKHLEENLADMEKGPLPEEVLQALDAGWEREREGGGGELLALMSRDVDGCSVEKSDKGKRE